MSGSLVVRSVHQLPKVSRRAPGFSGSGPVAHAVAVRAQACEVVQPALACSGDMKGNEVMDFDVLLTQFPVRVSEAERTDFAPERFALTLNMLDLLSPKPGVPFTDQGPSDEEAPLNGRGARFIDLVGLCEKQVQLAGSDAVLNGLRGLEHLGFSCDEGLDHELRRPTAAGCFTGVVRVVCHEIRRFAAHAVHGSERRQRARRRFVQRQRPEQFRQLLDLKIPCTQFTPAVPRHEGSGQHEFVLGPGRYPHVEYRMCVRCGVRQVRRTVGRAAKLVRSRCCQWGLSPSVMVDCKVCLPLHDCKEGA